MRSLCFHGGSTNGEHFEKVLYHLRQNLEADNRASFHFIDGLYDFEPSPDIEYQSLPPSLVFFDQSVVAIKEGSRRLAHMLTFNNLSKPEDKAQLTTSLVPRTRSRGRRTVRRKTCQEEDKVHIMHDKGHVIPHTEEMMVEMADFARRVERAARVPL